MPEEIIKAPGQFDCLKSPSVLVIENLHYSPFHLAALILLICAIIHTLFVHKIYAFAKKIEAKQTPPTENEEPQPRSIAVQALYFLAEVEIVFAIWVIPLFFTIAGSYGWKTALEYINTRDFTEALFIVIILSLATTRPILQVSQTVLEKIAHKFGGTLSAWWFVLLTVGPLLGSIITEPGAMAITALLLSKKFYRFHPSPKLAYATLALLFTNVSVGGVLTNFASPAVLILSRAWHWSNWHMFAHYGWKAAVGILLANALYWLYFRKEFAQLNERKRIADKISVASIEETRPIPKFVTAIHLLAMFVVVLNAHYPAIFIAAYLFFVGFHQSTRHHQDSLKMMRPLLVGLFIAGLVIHGGLQGWWVVKALLGLKPLQILGMTISLTGFNDNTAIAYLATLIQNLSDAAKYALVTGVICGGGLTVIANAPNPAGFVILAEYFQGSASSWKIFLAALLPTCVLFLIYSLFGPLLF